MTAAQLDLVHDVPHPISLSLAAAVAMVALHDAPGSWVDADAVEELIHAGLARRRRWAVGLTQLGTYQVVTLRGKADVLREGVEMVRGAAC